MQTRHALRIYRGGNYDSDAFGPALSKVADSLLQAFDEREEARMADAEARDARTGKGPLYGVLRDAARELVSQKLVNCHVPAVTTMDALRVMHASQRAATDDRGLRVAYLTLKTKWEHDPHSVLTIAELAELKSNVMGSYPRSTTAQVIDREVLQFAAHTLDMPLLVRLASQIQDEESFDRIVVANGFDHPDNMRALLMLKALVGMPDEVPPAAPGSLADNVDDALTGGPGGDMGGPPMDSEPMNDEDDGMFPHDEGEEMSGVVPSPNSGVPIVIEVAPAETDDDLNEPGMEVPEDLGMDDGTLEDVDDANEHAEEEYAPAGMLQERAGQLEDDTSVLVLEDPTAEGELLEVTIRRLTEESEPDVEDSLKDFDDTVESRLGDPSSSAPSADGDGVPQTEDPPGFHPEGAFVVAKGPPGAKYERMVRHIKTHLKDDPKRASKAYGRAWKAYNDDHDKAAFFVLHAKSPNDVDPSVFTILSAASLDDALTYMANQGVQGAVRLAASGAAMVELPTGELLHIAAPKKKLPGATRGFNPGKINQQFPGKVKVPSPHKLFRGSLKTADVPEIAGALGVSATAVETALLDGQTVTHYGHSIHIESSRDNDVVVFGSRTASLFELDATVFEYQTAVVGSALATAFEGGRLKAANLRSASCAKCKEGGIFLEGEEKCACGADMKAALKTASMGYLIMLELPEVGDDKLLRLRQARVERAVKAIARDATVESDGRFMGVTLTEAQPRTLARISNVLRTQFGIREMAAAGLPVPTPGMPVVPGQQPTDSPFLGPTPTHEQPAGQPAAPQSNMQQPATTGFADQQRFMQEHTNPLDPAKMRGPSLASRHQAAPPFMPADVSEEEAAAEDAAGMDAAPEMPPGEEGAPPELEGGELPGAGGRGQAALSPEDEEMVRSAFRHYHSLRKGLLASCATFAKEYGEFLMRFGPEESPERHLVEAQCGGVAAEVQTQPMFGRMMAAIPVPKKINQSHPGKVKVDKKWPSNDEDRIPTPRPLKNNRPKVTTTAPKPQRGLGGEPRDVGSFGAHPGGRAPVRTQAPKPAKGLGGDMMTGENDMTRRMEEVSRAAPGAPRSKLRSKPRRN